MLPPPPGGEGEGWAGQAELRAREHTRRTEHASPGPTRRIHAPPQGDVSLRNYKVYFFLNLDRSRVDL